jgi:hypothetical protein
MDPRGRNSACIVPDNMSFFDSEYGEYTDDLEYISSYVADDVQRYFNLNVKPGTKLGIDLVRGLRPDISNLNNNIITPSIPSNSNAVGAPGAHKAATQQTNATALAVAAAHHTGPSSSVGRNLHPTG